MQLFVKDGLGTPRIANFTYYLRRWTFKTIIRGLRLNQNFLNLNKMRFGELGPAKIAGIFINAIEKS